jgi:environmental stress-induced protein Ves
MQIVRRSTLKAIPWKNGGGITHEVIRSPPGADVFDWRVSVAQIAVSGPFSNFQGYRRTMVLLEGEGVSLAIGDRDPLELRAVGDVVEFDGAAATHCRLLGGRCTDLNFMVSKKTHGRSRTAIERLRESRAVDCPRGTTLIFAISRAVSLDAGDGRVAVLEPWDLAALPAGETLAIAPAAREPGGCLVFLAAVDDNS